MTQRMTSEKAEMIVRLAVHAIRLIKRVWISPHDAPSDNLVADGVELLTRLDRLDQ